MSGAPRDGEEGVILVNILLFVAIAAAVVALMIGREDGALARAVRQREAARALAIAHGGEASAVTALRRDMVDAPDLDHAREAWGAVNQRAVAIQGGAFDLAVTDATGRFNVNAVMKDDPAALLLLQKIGRAAGVPDALGAQAVGLIRATGPVSDLSALERSGLDAATLARLKGLVTALPYDSKINLNAASEPMLAILFDDPLVAARLAAARKSRGFLDPSSLSEQKVSLPPGAGFTSDLYWVAARVRIGDTAQRLTSLLLRRKAPDGAVTVVPVQRRIGTAGAIG